MDSHGNVDDAAVQEIESLCRTVFEDVSVDGGGISFLTDRGYAGTVWTSDTVALRVEELQFTLGEGPCVDAVGSGQVVLEPDLAAARGSGRRRWPGFAPEAVQAGVGAIFGLPLAVGSTSLGALDLYREAPGPLTPRQLDQARAVAEATSSVLLRFEPEEAMSNRATDGSAYHWAVHQAAGMISQQLDILVEEALVKLRASAFSNNRSIDELAADVVGRRRRFTEEDR